LRSRVLRRLAALKKFAWGPGRMTAQVLALGGAGVGPHTGEVGLTERVLTALGEDRTTVEAEPPGRRG
jgi:hypothetical protein